MATHNNECSPFAAFDELSLADMRKCVVLRKAEAARVAGLAGHPQRAERSAEVERLRSLLLALDAEAARRSASRLVAAVQGLVAS